MEILNAFKKWLYRVGIISLLSTVTSQAMAVELPRIQFTNGDVQVLSRNGVLRPAVKGDAIRPGEKIITGHGGMAQLKVFEQGVVALRENTQVNLQHPYGGQFSVDLESGLLRTVTSLGKRQGQISIKTPGAEINVKKGDLLTHVSKADKQDVKETLNQVLLGDVKITTGKVESIQTIGKIVKIDTTGAGIKELSKVPEVLSLRVDTLATSENFNSSLGGGKKSVKNGELKLTEITVNQNALKNTGLEKNTGNIRDDDIKVGSVTRSSPVVGVKNPIADHPVILNYDKASVLNPTNKFGLTEVDRDMINNSLVLTLRTPLSQESDVILITTANPDIRKNLISTAKEVEVTPDILPNGNVILTTTKYPEIKLELVDATPVISVPPVTPPVVNPPVKPPVVTPPVKSPVVIPPVKPPVVIPPVKPPSVKLPLIRVVR